MKISAYFMEVSENGVVFAGRMGVIENNLEQIQEYMGGSLNVIRLTEELVVIQKQEAGEQRLPVNRAIVRNGKIEEILTGNLICVRQSKNRFCSIENADIQEIRKYLKPVFDLDGKLIVESVSDLTGGLEG